jgi:transcriptional regulator with XRE-family HTH domain
MMRNEVDPRFGDLLRALLEARGISYRALAARVYQSKTYVHDLASGRAAPTVEVAQRLDEALGAGGALIALVRPQGAVAPPASGDTADDPELEAVELARRVEASDVSDGTLSRLERAADRMAMSYAGTPPAELLPQVRRYLNYVTGLVDVRMTIEGQRRLLVVGGWLSLLAATLHIDLRQRSAAEAWLATAEQMAAHAGHDEIRAWCLETRAWDVLTDGRFAEALALAQRARAIAPAGGSALIQATAQEGRAWARMGNAGETRDALERVARLVSNLPTPEHPEHHYRYDPAKAISYTATTLAWVGDPAAEEFARSAIDELLSEPGGVPRPRRVASARLDLALALLAADRPDEASTEALSAVTSGRIVPSNWWRAAEVLAGVESSGVREAKDLRDACLAFRPTQRELTS